MSREGLLGEVGVDGGLASLRQDVFASEASASLS
jgi:hypothetical protein